MATKTRKPNRTIQAWIDARQRHHLSHAQVQMARELGMNPAKLGKLDNHAQEPWKMPLTLRLPAIVGRARVLEIICTGRELDAPPGRPDGREWPLLRKSPAGFRLALRLRARG